jgi:polar amino acid transport system permease protein
MIYLKKSRETLSKILFTILFFLLLFFLFSSIDYDWQLKRVFSYFFRAEDGKIYAGVLINGLLLTLKISVVSFLLALVVGFVSATGRISSYYSLRILSYVYVEIVRNTPLIIQILLSYFVVSAVFKLDGFYAAVVTLGMFEGAYISEIIRGSILSIDVNQWKVASALGMNKYQILWHVILPQAYQVMLPSLGNIVISTVKDSSLLSIISVYELTFEAQQLVSETFLTFEVWFIVALIYFLINMIISYVIRVFEKHAEVVL